eukprot:TRINITY_DN810_c0_g1_i14.p4 TRINITY_DN810_c0_g1~~TRINITY_DN810_c0_g1_i14.p4  ORF type:complete len:142 (-),score=2.19 TRINITY_DN810_c0_g1_i14:189-614(-)
MESNQLDEFSSNYYILLTRKFFYFAFLRFEIYNQNYQNQSSCFRLKILNVLEQTRRLMFAMLFHQLNVLDLLKHLNKIQITHAIPQQCIVLQLDLQQNFSKELPPLKKGSNQVVDNLYEHFQYVKKALYSTMVFYKKYQTF